MKKKTLRFGLIGCGRIAQRHAELLASDQTKNAELVAVCDLETAKASKISEKFSIPYYSNMTQMFAEHELDAVSVLTESGNHADDVLKASNHNVNVIVEKPIALKVNDAIRMNDAFKDKATRLFVVKQNRFNKPVAHIKQLIDRGLMGKMQMGTARVRWSRDQNYYDQAPWRGTWGMDGGVLANQASHHVDLLQWLLGDIHSVYAKSATFLANIEAEDTLVAVLKFKNGALGTFEASTAVRPDNLEGSISVMGSTGSAEVAGFAANELRHLHIMDAGALADTNLAEYSTNPPNVYGFGHKLFYEHVVDCILNNKPSMLEGDEGIKSLKVINAIYESIEKSIEIILDETNFESQLGTNSVARLR